MEPRKLTRSRTDKVFSGVCGGLGKYFNIDSVILRILFVALLFGACSGLLLYIILWIVVPYENNANDIPNNPDDNQPPTNQSGSYVVGIILIVMGSLFLFQQWMHISFSKLWPILLIVIGIIMIASYLQKNKTK